MPARTHSHREAPADERLVAGEAAKIAGRIAHIVTETSQTAGSFRFGILNIGSKSYVIGAPATIVLDTPRATEEHAAMSYHSCLSVIRTVCASGSPIGMATTGS